MLYLQYNESGHMDGGGAQTHRKLAIYSLAAKNGIGYIENPLIGVITPSFSPEVEARQEILASWNQLTASLPTALSFTSPRRKELLDPWLSQEFFKLLLSYKDSALPHKLTLMHLFNTHVVPAFLQFLRLKLSRSISHLVRAWDKIKFFYALYTKKDCILTITEPFHVIQVGNDYVHHSAAWQDLKTYSHPVKIGVHVRRGDLEQTDTMRYLPDAYYISILQNLSNALKHWGLTYSIVYYVDFPHTDNYFEANKTTFSWGFLTSEETYSINIEDDARALKSLSLSDVIIGSKSSYSFVAGLVSKAVVIQPQWWIDNPSNWITVKLDTFNLPILETWGEEK